VVRRRRLSEGKLSPACPLGLRTAGREIGAISCPGATLQALEGVGHYVYEESASGRIMAEALYRLESSRALIRVRSARGAGGQCSRDAHGGESHDAEDLKV
jgi:hypothetical protein